MASPAPEPQKPKPKLVYTFEGKAIKLPPGQRSTTKHLPRFDDPVIPRWYWYWTGGLVALALVLGLLLGRFLLG
jgi:hypothetical protein